MLTGTPNSGHAVVRWLIVVTVLCMLTIVPFLLWAETVELWIADLDRSNGTRTLGVIIVALLTFDVVLPIPR